MASLTPKVIGGRTYYYARECQRVDGKPKIVKTTYLGSLDHILAALSQAKTPLQPKSARLASFGDVAALYDQAQQIGLVELIDAQIPKRDQGLSTGQYLLLAALNRAAHPTSKAQLADWYHHTVLPRLLPATTDQLSSQAFWNHMERVTEADIRAIEQALSQRLIHQLKLSLRLLVYDGTNFFTFINTRTPARLPARGHNKQHRGDLRQVSLGLLVSTDFHVPLFHLVYTGNLADATAFQSVSEELAKRYRQLAQGCEHITLIFDNRSLVRNARLWSLTTRICSKASCRALTPASPRHGANSMNCRPICGAGAKVNSNRAAPPGPNRCANTSSRF